MTSTEQGLASPAALSTSYQAPPAEEPDDLALVHAAIADPRQFAALYRRYVEPIYRYCYVRLGSREAAEDATSEIFLKVFANLRGFRSGHFPAWLFRITRNVVIDIYRERRNVQPIEAAHEVLDLSPGPEELSEVQAERRVLYEAMQTLPEDQRTVLELQLAGWSGREIARAIDRTEPAVKMLRFRAVGRLRELLAGQRNGGR